ncbi:glycosyltransferase family 2 protein [Pseudomonas faucium]|uniref:glycosyltransferase family 2 protein n=1 Tax=Pseudomonas faucium TaxID=2740518 RepID=UPI001F3BC20C|nr:glycosyltransferase family 2 protein [Pseudomonas faucium]
MNSSPLVSIVIPAYKPQFFQKALYSAMIQDHGNLEIVICDDCPDGSIAEIVEQLRPVSRVPIRYFRNETPLREYRNLARAIREAQGEYVKFLYDDDLLMPTAVSKQLAAMQRHPEAALVSAKRVVVDEADKVVGETIVTIFPFAEDVLIEGEQLVSFLGEHLYNFIGEPSCVMCRRQDVLAFGDDLMCLDGEVMHWVGDLAIYVKLLRQGDLVMLKETLGCFRISESQWSQVARTAPEVRTAPYERFREVLRGLGWVRPTELNSRVNVAALAAPRQFHALDLAAYFSSEGMSSMGNDSLQGWFNSAAKATPVRHWLAQRTLTPAQQSLVRLQRERLAGSFSLLVVVLSSQSACEALALTLQGLRRWQASTTSQLQWHVIDDVASGRDWVDELNALLQRSDMDWLVILQAGDELLESATLMLDMEMPGAVGARLVYCDELYRGPRDLETAFRPGPNLDLLLSLPVAMSGHWLMARQQVVAAGGFDSTVPGAIEFDMILRLIEDGGLQGMAHLSEPLLLVDAPSVAQNKDEVACLQRHLQRRGYADARVDVEDGRRYRITYHHAARPLVSIVVMATHDLPALQRCLQSVLGNTDYTRYEVLVVDQQPGVGVREWLHQVMQVAGGQLRIVEGDVHGSRAAAINAAARQAGGEYLVLLEGDVVAVRKEWLGELLNHAQRPEVCMVAGKVVSADGKVQHSGLIAGLNGVVGPAFDQVSLNQRGYMQRLVATQNYSAVPCVCVMMRTARLLEVGGLDEAHAPGPLSDLDLCLRMGQGGGLVVWTPYALMVQQAREVVSSDIQSVADIAMHWTGMLAADPAYNANLTLDGEAFALEPRVGLSWRPLPWRPLPVVLVQPCPQEEQHERRISVAFEACCAHGLIDGVLEPSALNMAELRRLAPDAVVFQMSLDHAPLQAMQRARSVPGLLVVLEVGMHVGSQVLIEHPQFTAHWQVLSQAAALADRVIVPDQALANALAPLHADIRVHAITCVEESPDVQAVASWAHAWSVH